MPNDPGPLEPRGRWWACLLAALLFFAALVVLTQVVHSMLDRHG
jgi:hypothetical protein